MKKKLLTRRDFLRTAGLAATGATLMACGPATTPPATPAPSATPAPTATPRPTSTPEPTATAVPETWDAEVALSPAGEAETAQRYAPAQLLADFRAQFAVNRPALLTLEVDPSARISATLQAGTLNEDGKVVAPEEDAELQVRDTNVFGEDGQPVVYPAEKITFFYSKGLGWVPAEAQTENGILAHNIIAESEGDDETIISYEVTTNKKTGEIIYTITHTTDGNGGWQKLNAPIVLTESETIFVAQSNIWERRLAESERLVAISKEQYPELAEKFGDISWEIYFHESIPDNGWEAVVQDPERALLFIAEVLRQHQLNNGKEVGDLDTFVESLKAGEERFDLAVIDADSQQMEIMNDLPINRVKVLVVPPNLSLELAVPFAFGQTGNEVMVGLSVDKDDPETLLVVAKANETDIRRSARPHLIRSTILLSVGMVVLPNNEAEHPDFGTQMNPTIQVTEEGGLYEAYYPIFAKASLEKAGKEGVPAIRFYNDRFPKQ